MSKQTFSVDDTLYRAQAKKLVKQLKLEEVEVVKEQAGLLAQLLAKVTPPFDGFPKMSGRPTYTTPRALKAGQKAVRAGFFSAVKKMGAPNKWDDKNIRAAIRRGDTAYLEARLKHMKGSNKRGLKVTQYSDKMRNNQRNTRGRVNRGTQPIVMLNDKDVNAGLRRALNNVGIAKASFAEAAVKLGRKAPPKWIARHFKTVNTNLNISRSPARVSFTADAKGLDVTNRRTKAVERFRMVAMVKRLEQLVRAEAKKSGFKTR